MSAPDGFVGGMRASAAVSLSALPFAMAVGVLAADGGATVAGALAMSVVMFAGAAQLAVLGLAKSGAPELLIVGVVGCINLRFSMYGAAVAPFVRHISRARRLGLAYLLTDQAFAVASARFADPSPAQRPASFFAGAALSLWVAWQIGTVTGAALGAQLPASLSLDFAAPLVFIALARLSIRTRADVYSAVSACATLGVLHWLPYGLALLPATAVGVLTGRALAGPPSTEGAA